MRMTGDLPRVITPATCVRLGLSRSQVRTALRRGHWRAMAPGLVLTRPDEPGRLDWADAGLVAGGAGAALSGWDACRLRGIGGRRPPRPTVLVLTARGRSRTIGDVLVRRTDRPFAWWTTPMDAELPRARVVRPARAVADTALWTPGLGDVRALVASAVQRGLAGPADIELELEQGPQQGSGFLRTALAESAEGARSAAEAEAAGQLRRAPLPPFELNVPVLDTSGTVLFVLDVLWRELRAALEIDSREYHFAASDWQATMRRHNLLTSLGIAVTHYPPSAITRSRRRWLGEVETWLRRRAQELGVPFRPSAASTGGERRPLIVRDAA